MVWAGEALSAVRVDDWPNPPRLLKTIMIHTHAFVGTITIQANLYADARESGWCEVYREDFLPIERGSEYFRNRVFSLRDRSVWMRCLIINEGGRVDRVMVL